MPLGATLRRGRGQPRYRPEPDLPGPFGQSTLVRFVHDLAGVGIGVYHVGPATPLDPVAAPVSPLRLTVDQAAAAALGAWSDAGMTGATLDGMAPVNLSSGVTLPLGAVIAGWAKLEPTPAGALARRILGSPDWAQYQTVVFPSADLLLFASDTVLHLDNSSHDSQIERNWAYKLPRPRNRRPVQRRTELHQRHDRGGLQSDRPRQRQPGRDQGPVRLLRPHPGRDRPGGCSRDKRRGRLRALRDGQRGQVATGALTAAMTAAAGLVATVAAVATELVPWTGQVNGVPNPTSKGVAAGVPGDFVLTATAPGSDLRWPGVHRRLRQYVQHPAPFAGAERRRGPMGHLSSATGRAHICRRRQREPGQKRHRPPPLRDVDRTSGPCCPRPARDRPVRVIATVHRKDLDQLRDKLLQPLLSSLPQIIQSTIGALLKPRIDAMLAAAASKVATIQDVQARVCRGRLLPHAEQQRRDEWDDRSGLRAGFREPRGEHLY